MVEVSVFLLLPESEPTNQWMMTTNELHSEESLNVYIKGLTLLLDEASLENFNGFYDKENVQNFLKDFDILEDYYPQPARRLLISSISDFYNWREAYLASDETTYTIFNQKISDHTFCEVGERCRENLGEKHLVLNHKAHTLDNAFDLSFNNTNTEIISIDSEKAIREWFEKNRIPERNFHVIPKHGENRKDVRIINGKVVSPLRCSRMHAHELLHSAIGDEIKELFNDDGEYYIVYKFEGANGQNMYHGYHVAKDSAEVPEALKSKLASRKL